MSDTQISVLLIESDPIEARSIEAALADPENHRFDLTLVTSLADALSHLENTSSDVLLLDLALPDCQGLDALHRILQVVPQAMVLVLTTQDDEARAREAVRDGAYDYLIKGHVDAHWLPRMLHHLLKCRVSETGLRHSEEALFDEKERAQVTLNSIGDAVLATDVRGEVTYMNLVAESMTGWPYKEALGRPLTEVFRVLDGESRSPIVNLSTRAIAENATVQLTGNCLLVRRDGVESAIEDSASPIHNRDGLITGTVIVFHDVSESYAMTQKVMHLAQHDFLTDLPNRALLTERLTQAIAQAQRRYTQVALLFLDLDYFKNVNDSLGHLIGDKLLQSVAARLKSCIRTTDTVSRQGGDEFVILLTDIEEPQDISQVAEKLLAAFSQPHHIDGNELHITLSIGISVYPDDGFTTEHIMKNADTAMYRAKENGRNNYMFFRADMNKQAVHRLLVEKSLRRALKQSEFILYYQPQIDLTSGAVTGIEALIRWLDPHLGLVYPDQFVSIAEESGLIVPIGRWVLREACRQVHAWQLEGLSAVPVAVNISAVEFRHKDFVTGLALILKETGLDPKYLELEMTESVLMRDGETSIEMLDAIKEMGVQLAIDDFGTGYSSLSYLKRFPINTLKIDQSFVHDIATDSDDAAIVGAVIGMGKSLRQRVIAEGIENQAQLDMLRLQHCNEGQGFQFSHPLSAADFSRWLTDRPGFKRTFGGPALQWEI